MRRFSNILFISHGVGDETEALQQALSLAQDNEAALTVLVIHPGLPDYLGEYKAGLEEFLMDGIKKLVQTVRARIHPAVPFADDQIAFEVEGGATPSVRIIQRVLRNEHDLIVKEKERSENKKGFKALDMDLLRKCPCPVWLSRPFKHEIKSAHVAVAIDPISQEPAGRDLAHKLLEISHSLAQRFSGQLSVVSCWEYAYESSLEHSVFIRMPKGELKKLVEKEQTCHRKALEALVLESGAGGAIYHIKGQPDRIIPAFVDEKSIDILVMGTVARIGIPGFIIGNTAENVLQKIGCSLLALKPNGFISPIEAY